MFEPSTHPRLFRVSIGNSFATSFAAGLIERTANLPPETLGRTEIFVNTRRMERAVDAALQPDRDARPASCEALLEIWRGEDEGKPYVAPSKSVPRHDD